MCAFLAFHAINPHSHTSARARKCVSFYFYIGCAGYIQHGNAYTIVYWNVQFNLLFVNEWNGTVFPSVASTLYANWMLNCIYKLRNGICQEWRKKTLFSILFRLYSMVWCWFSLDVCNGSCFRMMFYVQFIWKLRNIDGENWTISPDGRNMFAMRWIICYSHYANK